MKLSAIGEFGLLEKLNRFWRDSQAGRDDCAVISVPPGKHLLFSTDTMVEGRHFLRAFSRASEIGFKLLAVNISDIAAMGGIPAGVLITLQLPSETEVAWVEELYQGIGELADVFKIEILGGDTVESKTLSLGVAIVGFSEKPPLTRSGATPGDDIWVSGEIGAAGAGLRLLQSGMKGVENASLDTLTSRYQRPNPRVLLGRRLLGEDIATSLIDVSDGLFQDAEHLARMSAKKFVLDTAMIPLAGEARKAGLSILEAASCGDDYELLFTASQGQRDKLEALTMADPIPRLSRIGMVSEGCGQVFLRHEGREALVEDFLPRGGFQHFRTA